MATITIEDITISVVFQNIGVGTVANDGTGDPLRTAFIKVNSNFASITAEFGSLTAQINAQFDSITAQVNAKFVVIDAEFTAIYALIPTDSNGDPIPMAPIESPIFTGDPQVATTPPIDDDDNSIATTHWVRLQGYITGVDLTAYAKLDSPEFVGIPTAPTAAFGTDTIQLATTAFVQAALLGADDGGGVDDGTIPPVIAKAIGASLPEGRLTLQSHEPVMSSSVSGATTIFYTPYIGAKIPLYDGTKFLATRFDEMSALVSDAVHSPSNGITAGKVYDWFVWLDTPPAPAPAVMRLCHGPEWADVSTRSAGTGIVRIEGIWINSAAITNGPAAQRGTYVGTTYCQVTNKLTWVHGATGARARYHIWNAFNRVSVGSTVIDSSESWTANAGSIWEMLNANPNNRAEAVCGLQEESFDLTMLTMSQTQPGDNTYIAIGLDWTSGAPDPDAVYVSVGESNTSLQAHHVTTPGLGFHFWQVLQASDTGESTFYGSFAPLWASGLTFNGRM